jgi:adenine-specific DNA-methyltransferase
MVFQRDANELVRSSDAGDLDVAYLDPPYNQHQYGSNYHMLNTIARWDKIPMPISFGPMGDLTDKAGIRRDWKNTKSAYCSRSTAAKAFQEMLADLDARRIVLSYSTDGIIAFDELREMCETRGNVSIVTNEYSKFKGGRQSNTRATKNIEFVLVVDTDRKLPKPKASIVDTALCMRRLRLLFSSRYRKCDLMRHFDVDLESEAVDLRQSSGRRRIETSGFFRLTAPCWLDQISADEAARLVCALEQCACRTCDEQLEEIERLVKEKHADAASFVNEMPALLRKLANPKYVDLYYGWAERIEKLAAENCGLLAPIKQKIMRLADIAEKRLASRTG